MGTVTISAINVAPVKSLGLVGADRVDVGWRGIAGDRRFMLLDEAGRVITQRQIGALTRVRAEYADDGRSLRMSFPDGRVVEGVPEAAGRATTVLWGRVMEGDVVGGEWGAALSEFCGTEVRLFESDAAGACFDEYPVSVISRATIEYLSSLTRGLPGGAKSFEPERFRPTLLLDGCDPHEEDGWLGKGVQVGDGLRMRMVARDPRCAITTLDPATGERDFDTLRLILSYRPSVRAAYLGVYGIVESPGAAAVGDGVAVGS